MSRKFDLVVIGTGTAASVAATRCRGAGWSVAVIDELPFGGTCALRGCDPKKVLVGAAEALEWSRRLEGKGIRQDRLQIDWPELMRFKRSIIASVPEQKEEGFRKAGVDVFHGTARFTGPTLIDIGGEQLEAGHVLIASGAKPMPLGIDGEDLVTTSTQFLELDELPRRIVFIGGGFISFEFSHIVARAGAKATILQRGRRFLPLFDADLVERLAEKSRSVGIELRLNTSVIRVEQTNGALIVHAREGDEEIAFEADVVVHGAGRVPAVDGLGLDVADIELVRGRLSLNDFLQSVSNPAVYAAGDAASVGPALTPVAAYDGRIVAANLLDGNHLMPDYSIVPSVAFTTPPLASVGLTEDAARQRGLRFRSNPLDTSSWYSSRRVNETHSGSKVLVEEESGLILGAHLLGPSAEETINLFAMAMQAGVTSSQIERMLFAYPTHGSDVAYML